MFVESIMLLSGQDVGEYDALFLVGLHIPWLVFLMGCSFTILHMGFQIQFNIDWGLIFAGFLSVALCLYMARLLFGFIIPFLFCLGIHHRDGKQNTLRMLTKWKGMVGVVVGMLLVLGVFHLTPAKNVGRMAMKKMHR